MDVKTFSMLLIALGSIFGLITLVYVVRLAFSRQAGEIGGWQIRGSGRTITAVARSAIAEGLRAKLASGFALILLISVPLFWLTAEGDGTIKGTVQMFMTYSLGFAGFVLSLLTIFFSCRSLSQEIASRQIYGIVSKPVPRWQILAGKWLGVMTLNVVLLSLVGIGTYIGTQAITRTFKKSLHHELITSGGLTPEQSSAAVASLNEVRGVGKKGMESPIVSTMAEAIGLSRRQIGNLLLKLPEPTRVDLRRYDELRRQVLVARAAVHPDVPYDKIRKAVEQRFEQLREEGNLPERLTERQIREEIGKNELAKYRRVPPGTVRLWKMKGPLPKRSRDFIMSIRFKLHIAATLLAFTDTASGETLDKDTLLCLWAIGDPRTANYSEFVDTQPANTFQELEIPTNCIQEDGTIELRFANMDPRNVDVIFDLSNGLQVLYRIRSFGMNLLQACLAILLSLACLASFGVCASTFLSFPVASLILVGLYLISISMGFVADSMAVSNEYTPADPGLDWEIRRIAVEAIGTALSLGDMHPTSQLTEGRVIDWSVPWQGPLKDVLSKWPFALVKSMLIMLVGIWVFRRRELAAVIV